MGGHISKSCVDNIFSNEHGRGGRKPQEVVNDTLT